MNKKNHQKQKTKNKEKKTNNEGWRPISQLVLSYVLKNFKYHHIDYPLTTESQNLSLSKNQQANKVDTYFHACFHNNI